MHIHLLNYLEAQDRIQLKSCTGILLPKPQQKEVTYLLNNAPLRQNQDLVAKSEKCEVFISSLTKIAVMRNKLLDVQYYLWMSLCVYSNLCHEVSRIRRSIACKGINGATYGL